MKVASLRRGIINKLRGNAKQGRILAEG